MVLKQEQAPSPTQRLRRPCAGGLGLVALNRAGKDRRSVGDYDAMLALQRKRQVANPRKGLLQPCQVRGRYEPTAGPLCKQAHLHQIRFETCRDLLECRGPPPRLLERDRVEGDLANLRVVPLVVGGDLVEQRQVLGVRAPDRRRFWVFGGAADTRPTPRQSRRGSKCCQGC